MTLSPPPISLPEYRFILKRDFASFIHASFYELNPNTPFIPGPHIELIAAKLEACRRGEIKRLIINIPPRNLKSQCASIAFPAWVLGHNPGARVVCASYGQELAEKLARDTRKLMSSDFYCMLFATRLSDRQAVHDFETTESGGRMATSVGGPITGRGGDFLILDDPLKPDEALSEIQRTAVNTWYQNTLLSRLNDKATGCIIIVMQRLHQDDLVGHVLERDNWEVISFPAIAEAGSCDAIESPFGRKIFRRKVGEALHPDREPIEILQGIRRQVSEYNFASQYQQSPIPMDGGLIKKVWLKYYEPGAEPARFQNVVQSWDTANKAGELNDYSVCTTWGMMKNNFYLLHVWRRRVEFPALKQAVIEQRNRFKPRVILIEDKASGTQLIQELKHSGIPVKPYTASSGTDKIIRLATQATFFESGRIMIPKEAHWLDDYVNEITGFPGTKYADQVDSTSQFLDHMRSCSPPLYISDDILRRFAMPNTFRRRNSLTPNYPDSPFFSIPPRLYGF